MSVAHHTNFSSKRSCLTPARFAVVPESYGVSLALCACKKHTATPKNTPKPVIRLKEYLTLRKRHRLWSITVEIADYGSVEINVNGLAGCI